MISSNSKFLYLLIISTISLLSIVAANSIISTDNDGLQMWDLERWLQEKRKKESVNEMLISLLNSYKIWNKKLLQAIKSIEEL